MLHEARQGWAALGMPACTHTRRPWPPGTAFAGRSDVPVGVRGDHQHRVLLRARGAGAAEDEAPHSARSMRHPLTGRSHTRQRRNTLGCPRSGVAARSTTSVAQTGRQARKAGRAAGLQRRRCNHAGAAPRSTPSPGQPLQGCLFEPSRERQQCSITAMQSVICYAPLRLPFPSG